MVILSVMLKFVIVSLPTQQGNCLVDRRQIDPKWQPIGYVIWKVEYTDFCSFEMNTTWNAVFDWLSKSNFFSKRYTFSSLEVKSESNSNYDAALRTSSLECNESWSFPLQSITWRKSGKSWSKNSNRVGKTNKNKRLEIMWHSETSQKN